MSWEACIAEIRAAAGEDAKLSERDIERVLDKVVAQARRKSGIGAPTAESLRDAAKEIAGQARLTGAIERRNALINLGTRIGRRERVEAHPGGLAAGIRAEIHGTATPTEGGRFSGEAEWKALTRQYLDGAVGELERGGLLRAARSRDMERDWTRELFELSKGRDGNPGVSNSPEALTIAQILHKYQTLSKASLNRAGGWIGDYSGYIARTAHDPDRIRRAGLAEWKDSIRPLLDERTFDEVGADTAAREKFLDNVYHGLITGVHLTHDGMQGFKDPAFTGPANLAEKISRERVLHFAGADAWLDYQRRFGNGNVLESVLHGMDWMARATALMHRWGTNPRAEFAADLRYFQEENRNLDPAKVDRLRQAEKDLQNRFDFLDGTANIPANRLGAQIGSTLRIIQSMAKLGGMALTDFTGIATHAAELKYQGIGLLQGYANAAISPFRGRGAAGSATREVMDQLLAGHEGMLRDIMARFEPDDTLPGTLSKLANLFFKMTGSVYLNTTARAGAEFAMARELGQQLGREHAALKPETQRILSMFGIGAREWELLRQAPDHVEIEGRPFLTPDAALRIPDLVLAKHLRDIDRIDAGAVTAANKHVIDDFRQELATRLHAYFNDRSEHIMIVPGIATRADLLRGTRPGTWEGELLRMFAQFKTWPAAMVRMALGREIYGTDSRPAAIAGILHMALAGTVLGYGVMALKDLIKGREPRDPASVKTWLAAMSQGGGFGILGDFLFGEYNRFGQSFTDTAAGPVIGQGVTSVLQLWNLAKDGKFREMAPELFRDVLNNTPFVNLFYLRTALDYLFLWQVQEALNPGFLRRFERRVKDQNRQNFWLSPTATVESRNAYRPRQAPVQPWSWTR